MSEFAGNLIAPSMGVANAPGAAGRQRWLTLTAVCAATFMLLVDLTIIQVALPQVQRELRASLTDLQWVIDAYALALAALILTCGSVADRIGRKHVFVAGVVIFTAASALCGLAGSATLLILARAVQGIGGAAMFATSLALIGQEFSGRERGTAIAAWGSTVGGAVAVGPLLGGVVTQALGWQWIFLVNLPIGVAVVALARTRIVNVSDPEAARLDTAGLAFFSGALFALIFGLLRAHAEGWGSLQIVASLAGAVVLLVLFVVFELRQPRPMFDLGLFRKPAFCGVSLGTFAIGSGMFAMLLYVTLYLQDVLGYSPLQGGLRLLPMTALVFVVPLLTRRIVARLPARLVLGGGLALVSLGLLLMHDVQASSHWTVLLAGMLVAGVGIGLANPAIATTALGVVAPTRTGMASGISNTFRVGGVATGIAALGALFTHRLGTELHTALPHSGTRLADAVSAGGLRAATALSSPAERLQTVAAARHAFVVSFNEILLVGAAVTLAGALGAFALIRGRDFESARQPAPTRAGADQVSA